MQRAIKLLRVMGIQISLDYTWFIIFGLVAWTLAQGYFPSVSPGLGVGVYIAMGIVSSILLFACVLIHELSHSYVANRLGMDIKEITLFIFGGVAQLTKEPDDPKVELKIAIAGPIATGLLAASFWFVKEILDSFAIYPVASSIFNYIVIINIVLIIFNMIPGFPLDGGRVLRAIWWMKSGDIQKATMIASRVGKGFALFLIFFGLLQLFTGNIIGGLWAVFIGIFLQQVAEGGYREVVIKKSLRGIIIGNIMTRGVITIEGDFSLQRIVDEYFFKYHFNSFPVISSSKLVGVLSLNDVRAISRDAWGTTKVRDVMKPIDQQAILSQESTALDALTKMVELGVGRLPVLGKGRLVGIISRRDLMKLMAFKTDLGI